MLSEILDIINAIGDAIFAFGCAVFFVILPFMIIAAKLEQSERPTPELDYTIETLDDTFTLAELRENTAKSDTSPNYDSFQRTKNGSPSRRLASQSPSTSAAQTNIADQIPKRTTLASSSSSRNPWSRVYPTIRPGNPGGKSRKSVNEIEKLISLTPVKTPMKPNNQEESPLGEASRLLLETSSDSEDEYYASFGMGEKMGNDKGKKKEKNQVGA
ncbi:hypothetical protein B0J11DRAFT_582857 [Dendryphion nanum]|uniref:Uncharacterized protein n=1 Tax=Dendryphion nanum TaxID=256645 RepID=A0A9P9DHH2_9PLEO|nr:hypothetical protein B0J11DRAFT_582857 [Dendryphion nanum]